MRKELETTKNTERGNDLKSNKYLKRSLCVKKNMMQTQKTYGLRLGCSIRMIA